MPKEMYAVLSKYIDFDSVNVGIVRDIGVVFKGEKIPIRYMGGTDFVTIGEKLQYQFDWPQISDAKLIVINSGILFGPLSDLEIGDTLSIKSKTTELFFRRNDNGLFKVLPSGRLQPVILNYSDRED